MLATNRRSLLGGPGRDLRGDLHRGRQLWLSEAAREAAFAFSWLTKPFESRKTGHCKIDLCFPFSHHEQNKNIAGELQSGLSVDGAAQVRALSAFVALSDVEAYRKFVCVLFPKGNRRDVSE